MAARGDLIRPYTAPTPLKEDDQPPDWGNFMSLIVGVGNLMLRKRYLAWFSLFVFTYSIVNGKRSAFEFRNAMTSCSFVLMGFFQNYLTPAPSAPSA